GITVQNTSAANIVIDKITVNWNNANLIREIKIGGVKVWSNTGPGTPSGKQPSGTLINIQDVTLAPGAAATLIDRFRFDASMSGATFNIAFTMFDGSVKTTGNFTR
ncbi:hypothetical protein HZB04_02565, partial [Candidatus Wolfebacteria bacterium]|nr:hypothetical protein [Candidatus Wolfebacteria bacterium]